jgi:hypothetical protein
MFFEKTVGCGQRAGALANVLRTLRQHVHDEGYTHMCLVTGPDQKPTSLEWIFDTGCTHSLLGDQSLFVFCYDVTPTPNMKVMMNSFPTPCVATAVFAWTVLLNDGSYAIMKTRVLLVPGSDYNLLSHDADDVLDATIGTGTCSLNLSAGTVTATRLNGLFRVPFAPAPRDSHTALASSSQPIYTVTPPVHPAMRVVHSALGHVGASTIHRLIRSGYISVPDPATRTAILAVRNIQCPQCSATSVPKSPPRAEGHEPHRAEPTLWSADACFINTPSIAGNKLLSGWLCHRVDKLFVSYHKRKSDITPWFIQNKTRMEQEAATAMRVLRTDNGSEYCNTAFADYCATNGITRQHTSPGSSFQNSNIEVRFRDIRSHSGASLLQSGLPSKFWPEAVSHWIYLYERLPTAHRASAFEQIYGRRPVLSLVHPFGCLAFAHLDGASKSGLRPRTTKCVYLGPATTTKDGHRLLSLETGRLVVNRNVRFVDGDFPLAQPTIDNKTAETPLLFATDTMDHADPLEVEHAPTVTPNLPPRAPSPAPLGANVNHLPPRALDVGPVHDVGAVDVEPRAKSTRVRSAPAPLYDPSGYRAQEVHDRRGLITALVNNTNIKLGDGPDTDPETVADIYAMEPGERRSCYIAALHTELKALLDNGTWRRIDAIPRGRNAIPSRVVLKVKLDSDGLEARFKARLVAKGFRQRAELDFGDLFSPTLRFNTLRALLAAAVQHKKTVHQTDIETAFLHADVEEEIFMKLPEYDLLRKLLPDLPIEGPYVQILKSLYGLRQSPRNFHHHLTDTLRSIGFTQSDADPCLWLKVVENTLVAAIAIFVDDLAIAADACDIADIKDALRRVYKMTDGGPINFFLGVRMHQDLGLGTLSMVQDGAVARLLKAYGMNNAKSVSTPADSTPFYVEDTNTATQEEIDYMADKDLRALVGSLLYLLVTRPDISFSVNRLTRVVNKPRKVHWEAAMRVLRYLAGTANYGITYHREEENSSATLAGYSDADWAGDRTTRRSTTGFVFMLVGGAISYKCKLQRVVALSSCEAELMALAATVQECAWLRRLLIELCLLDPDSPTELFEDNQGAIALVKDRKFSENTKHMDIRNFYVRDEIENKQIKVTYCDTANMLADIFTKPLGRVIFLRLRPRLGVVAIAIKRA